MTIKQSSSFKSSIRVGGWTFVSRIAGLVRDIVTTSLLGASTFHDIFVVVLKIPNVFRRFFAEGAFSQAFIPIYSEYLAKDQEVDGQEFLNSLAGILISTLFIFTVIALAVAPLFILIFAPGFYFDDTKQALAVNLLQIMFPYLGLISLVAFASGIQNSHDRFSIPAATPVIFNLTIIACAIFLAPQLEVPVIALAWGVLLAGFLQLLLQIAPLMALQKLPIPKINFHHPGVKKFLILIVPALLAGGIAQINLLVDTIFASLLITGSPTWLYVSDRLIQFPLGIFAIAIGTVLLPTLSKEFGAGNMSNFTEHLEKGFKLIFFLAIPSVVGLLFYAEPLLGTIFHRGAFLWVDVESSALSLIAFATGLPFFMAMKVLVPAFFARQDTTTPMLAALLSLLVNIVLNYTLAFYFNFGHVGLAAASSIASVVSVAALCILLKRLNLLSLNFLLDSFAIKIFASNLLLVSYLIWTAQFFDFQFMTEAYRALALSSLVIGAMVVYFASSYAFGIRLKEFK